MPVVHIHGVRQRRDAAYEEREAARSRMFRRHLLARIAREPAAAHLEFTHWGDLATQFAWNLASVPRGPQTAFASPAWRTPQRPEAGGGEALVGPVAGAVRAGRRGLGRLAARHLALPAVNHAREHAAAALSMFIGDVLVYLHARGSVDQPGEIPQRIITGLRAAQDQVTDDDPWLVVIGHSMGANIAWDVLRSFAPDIDVDVFVTVGCQLSLFEELKLFRSSDAAVRAPDRIPRPGNIRSWINVFDAPDALGFAMAGIFDGVADFEHFSGRSLSAHGSYFDDEPFHRHLASRVADCVAALPTAVAARSDAEPPSALSRR